MSQFQHTLLLRDYNRRGSKQTAFSLTGASCYKVNQFLLVDLFYIEPIISVAGVERTGMWE
jgi:hypothetical protein